MLLLHVARTGWRWLLAAMPRPVLQHLDAWARNQAHRRALRRRRLTAERPR